MHASLARLLIHYSLRVQPGEVVSLHGSANAGPLVRVLNAVLTDAGAQAWTPQGPPAGASIHVSHPDDATNNLRDFTPPGHARWVATLYPPDDSWSRKLAKACFLDHPDPMQAWREMSRLQQAMIDSLQSAVAIRIVSPLGTDLTIPVRGARWINGDGQHNMPDGEIHTEPAGEGTYGRFVSDSPFRAELEIERGQVVNVVTSSKELPEVLAQSGGCRVCELGLGCNPAVTDFSGHALVDEKIAGTVHLGLGLGHSGRHLDLISDTRQGTVEWIDAAGSTSRLTFG